VVGEHDLCARAPARIVGERLRERPRVGALVLLAFDLEQGLLRLEVLGLARHERVVRLDARDARGANGSLSGERTSDHTEIAFSATRAVARWVAVKAKRRTPSSWWSVISAGASASRMRVRTPCREQRVAMLPGGQVKQVLQLPDESSRRWRCSSRLTGTPLESGGMRSGAPWASMRCPTTRS